MNPPSGIETRVVHCGWDEWDDHVRPLEGAGLFHRGDWFRVWTEVYGQEGAGLLAMRDGAVVAALPLIRKASLLFGRYWVSMPYFDAAGPVGDADACPALLDHALALARERGDEYVDVRTRSESLGGGEGSGGGGKWQRFGNKVHVTLALPRTRDELSRGLAKKVRSQVRRAMKEDPVVIAGGAELARDFHGVYTERMRDLGSPGHSRKLFERILAAFPEESGVVGLRLQDRCVAGAFLLRDGGTVVVPWAATNLEAMPLGMNMLLYFEALGWAIDAGAGVFDFGRTDADSSQLRFKLQWGGEERRLHWYRAAFEGTPPTGDARASARMQLASRIWRKLPVAMARMAGPPLIKRLS